MFRKYALFLAAGLALLLLAGFLLRPVTIHVDNETITVRGADLKVGQALATAGIQVYSADQVQPAIEEWIPLNGQIRLTRAVQAVIWEAGQTRLISGPERNAADLLAAAGSALQPGDRLIWNGREIDPRTELPAGRPVVLQIERARPVIIDLDGERQRIDTTAVSAANALWEAGIRPGPGDALSVPPGALLADLEEANGGPLILAYRAAQPVTIEAGAQRIRARTTAATVGEALAEAGIALQGLDYAEPAEDQPLPEDGRLRVVRVTEEIALTEELLPFDSQRVPDAETELDQTRVITPGQYGVRVVRERARFEDGEEVSRAVDSDWIASEPVAQTIGVGTMVVTKTLDSPDGAIEYWRAISVYATPYSPCRLGTGDGRCSWTTASGQRLTKGIIAVTLSWYRIIRGLRVYVPGYGYGVIADVGGGIPGRPWIDLGYDEENFEPFVGWTTMYFVAPPPENVSWILP